MLAQPVALTYWCDQRQHLVCTPFSVENLHQMATALLIPRHWFHAGRLPHYDIPKRRVVEIMRLCRVVDSRRIVEIIRGTTPELGDPAFRMCPR